MNNYLSNLSILCLISVSGDDWDQEVTRFCVHETRAQDPGRYHAWAQQADRGGDEAVGRRGKCEGIVFTRREPKILEDIMPEPSKRTEEEMSQLEGEVSVKVLCSRDESWRSGRYHAWAQQADRGGDEPVGRRGKSESIVFTRRELKIWTISCLSLASGQRRRWGSWKER